jgi:hypothetical protein
VSRATRLPASRTRPFLFGTSLEQLLLLGDPLPVPLRVHPGLGPVLRRARAWRRGRRTRCAIRAGSAGSSHFRAVRTVFRTRTETFSRPSFLDCAATGVVASSTQPNAHVTRNGSCVFMGEPLRLARYGEGVACRHARQWSEVCPLGEVQWPLFDVASISWPLDIGWPVSLGTITPA